MAINKTLKFSWGHIIAFIALIFISYVSFMGITYLTDGDFIYAGIGVFAVNLFLIMFFIVPQVLKGADERFSQKIVVERVLIFLSPIIFAALMIPYAHFWTVFEKRGEVETTFSESIRTTKQMFNSYERYANSRIKEYDEMLAHTKVSDVQRSNRVEALRLQLVDGNYNELKNSAIDWIDNATEATVWNVFIMGNIKEIEAAIEKWNTSLNSFSGKIMLDEPDGIEPFSSSVPSVVAAKDNLENLRSVYTTMEKPTIIAIAVGILLYLLLLFPYVIQSRNTKSVFRLFGYAKKSGTSRNKKNKRSKNPDAQSNDSVPTIDSDSSSCDDYGSFTF